MHPGAVGDEVMGNYRLNSQQPMIPVFQKFYEVKKQIQEYGPSSRTTVRKGYQRRMAMVSLDKE